MGLFWPFCLLGTLLRVIRGHVNCLISARCNLFEVFPPIPFPFLQTQDINRDQLKKMLDESNIDGGEIMPTLAQQMKEEFREEFKEQFMETMGPQIWGQANF
jgi:hypothetical protein